MNFDYFIPTKILFGRGKLDQLGTEPLPGKKPLIVISAGTAMKKHGYLKRVQTLLQQQDIESVVYDKILANPILEHVTEGAAFAKANGCDFIIGLGGGSSIDAAKSIAIMAKNPGNYWDYICGGSGKGQPIVNGALPIVAITTTAGTGTEADPWTVITNGEEKIGFGDFNCTFPALSIVDPELMTSIPPHLTAYQGFDAFFHAAEGVIANVATPISDIYALESIRLINTYLPEAIKNGSNIDAREQIALANTLSGMVESTSSCTSEHSLEHAMSAYHHQLPHGAGLIMLSLAYFGHFADKVPEKLGKMAIAMGATSATPEGFLDKLEQLQKTCGVDTLKMSDYGITEEELPAIATNARETMGGLFTVDPVPMSDAEALEIIKKAFR